MATLESQIADLLTAHDAGKILDLSAAAVRALERRGALPATRTRGGIRLFDAREVERLAARRRAAK